MNEETRNRLAAWFDGESVDQAEVEAILEKDAEARAYIEELQTTRSALAGAHARGTIPAPEWESVATRLDEGEVAGGIARSRASSIARILSPGVARSRATGGPGRVLSFPRALAAVAAIMILGIAIWIPFRQASISQSTASSELMVNSVEMVETDLEGVTPVVYLDQPSGWTVVWVLEDTEPSGI